MVNLKLSVLLVLTRWRHYLALATPYRLGRKFSLLPSHLAPSFKVTPFEFMEKLYGS